MPLLLVLATGPVTAADPFINAEDFRNPPLSSKPIPLWHLNGHLTKEAIAAQLKASRDISGFGGVAVLPVTATRPAYLTDEYFARYRDILDASRNLGMSVIFYDDINFPSGTAGGHLKAKFPDATTARLDKRESDVTGPLAWQQALPGGTFMGAVAMNQVDQLGVLHLRPAPHRR